jgi:hypothetical protein
MSDNPDSAAFTPTDEELKYLEKRRRRNKRRSDADAQAQAFRNWVGDRFRGRGLKVLLALVVVGAFVSQGLYFNSQINNRDDRHAAEISELKDLVEGLTEQIVEGDDTLRGDVNQEDLADSDDAEVASPDEVQDFMDAQDLRIAELEERLAALQDGDTVNERGPPEQDYDDPACPEEVTAWFVSQGFGQDDIRCGDFAEDTVERGDTSFSDEALENKDALVAFLNGDSEGSAAARAALRNSLSREDYQRALRGEGFTLVQMTVPSQYEVNTYLTTDGAAAFLARPRNAESGDKVWVYTNTRGKIVEAGNTRADCGNVRAERIVPQKPKAQPTVAQVAQQPAPQVVVKKEAVREIVREVVKDREVVEKIVERIIKERVVTEKVIERIIKEFVVVKEREVVEKIIKKIIVVVKEKEVEKEEPPKKRPPKKERPPKEEPPKEEPPEEEEPPKDKPPKKKPKCPYDKSLPKGHPDCVKPSGTPDEGAEQQDPQDNDPEQTAPTPGYEKGSAEETVKDQESAAGSDKPSGSGSQVPDSSDGGKAPAPPVVTPDEQPKEKQPENSGKPNPDHDGTPKTENPDHGTGGNPDTGEPPADTPASDSANDDDPFAGDLDLPDADE